MKKFSLAFIAGVAGLFTLMPLSQAQAAQFDNLVELAPDSAQQEVLEEVENQEVEDGLVLGVQEEVDMDMDIDRGPHFRYGETVVIKEDLVGDVYAAGGTVQVDGTIVGDLMVAGGSVVINGEVSDDVRVGAGNIMVNGLIGGNLTAGGGTIIFDKEASVGNSIVAGGGTISFDGEVLGNVWLGGDAVSLSGVFGKDINAQGNTLKVLPGVIVGGDLKAELETEAEVSEEAEIKGQKEVKTLTPKERREKYSQDERITSMGGMVVKAKATSFFFKFLIGMVSASIILYFFSKKADKLVVQICKSRASNLGWGLIYVIATPIVAVITMMTVVAFPVGIIIMMLYILSLMVVKWLMAYTVGVRMHQKFKLKWLKNKYAQLALGLLVLNVLYSLPLVGWLVSMIVGLIGLGAMWTMVREVFRKNQTGKKKSKK